MEILQSEPLGFFTFFDCFKLFFLSKIIMDALLFFAVLPLLKVVGVAEYNKMHGRDAASHYNP